MTAGVGATRAVASIPLRGPFAPLAWTRLSEDFVWLDSGVGAAGRGERSLVALELEPVLSVESGDRLPSVHGASGDGSPSALGFWAECDRRLATESAALVGDPAGLGWVGYVAYEAAPLFDGALRCVGGGLPFPVARVDRVACGVVDDSTGARVVALGDSASEARARAAAWAARLDAAAASHVVAAAGPADAVRLGVDDGDGEAWFVGRVDRIRAAIGAGEVYQACLTLPRWFEAAGVELDRCYERLRGKSPGDFGAYLRLGAAECASTSPERFLRVAGRRVEARPMKGTRPATGDADADRALATALSGSEKDRAENVMIVDLLRNDLGRVCEVGSVSVPSLFEVERYATVHQLTSTIVGTLREGIGPFGALAAAFPPGSMTGAPKVAACSLLATLESAPRGLYAGTIGWFGYDGVSELSVVIRTLQRWGDRLRWDAGGGIVWDSVAADEWREVEQKRAPLAALR
ncbi:MAG: anthranilate synthase component I family protein [Myxococcales bacterium]|nr:anthranilate synthase component I family protein [Myxococcales bacterium]MCB9532001.1 anthranilate synthase component I family protein [Myxococcales bacterium]MCB9533853.1 anthranilate synthase component I family protein [Myxococcales bacterium]